MAPSQQRREREKQAVREKILEAARELFVKLGYEAVTMRQIAEKIEYTPTAIYFHFQDKQALINELCAIDFLKLAKTFSGLAEVKNPYERLTASGFAYLEFGLKNPNHYRLIFMTPHPFQSPQQNKLIRRGNPAEDAYAFLRATVIECIAAGHFRKEYRDPEMVAQLLWAAIHGIVALHIARGNDTWIPWRAPQDTAATMLKALMEGLRAETLAAAPNPTKSKNRKRGK